MTTRRARHHRAVVALSVGAALLAGSLGAVGTASPSTAAPVAAWDRTFALSSAPGSKHTLYLDFLGGTVTGTYWNTTAQAAAITVAPFSLDAYTAHFSRLELGAIQAAWATVAQDYSPFDINVTTAPAPADAISRSSAADDTWGTRVMITDQVPTMTGCGCGGNAWLGSADRVSTPGTPAWVITGDLGLSAQDPASLTGLGIGNAISHEAGHTFGLVHQGLGSSEYYERQGLWAPIMGASSFAPMTQWSDGRYAGGHHGQDDMAILRSVLGPTRTARRGPSTLSVGATTYGMVTGASQVDTYTLAPSRRTRTVRITAAPTGLAPDLDLRMRVTDDTGRVVGTAAPRNGSDALGQWVTGLGAGLTLTVEAGHRYTVDVAPSGNQSTRRQNSSGLYDTYSAYGSVGAYRLSVAPSSGTWARRAHARR
ncbi:hypothetical protein [Nocardioides sp.]|uniref:hypothetical protein n=1 Tax=Nocardioides sp. TaxID=35761 RepID=UPI002632534C|nr:hypothetical protein [Nocardioides sp.]